MESQLKTNLSYYCYIFMMLQKTILAIVILFLPFISRAQQADFVLKKFFAVQVDETVFLRWTMMAGSTCEDTYVERSADGVTYERIGLIGGICGSPYEEITFEFTDSLPLVNQVAHYRLLLGYFGYTTPKTVEFVRYNEQDYFLGPNPFNDYVRIAFENKDKEEFHLLISDMKGQKVLEMMTTSNEFLIRREDLKAGTYSLILKKESEIFFKEKIIAN